MQQTQYSVLNNAANSYRPDFQCSVWNGHVITVCKKTRDSPSFLKFYLRNKIKADK